MPSVVKVQRVPVSFESAVGILIAGSKRIFKKKQQEAGATRRLPAVSDFYRGSALFEECDRHHAGASVRADHAANERGVERVCLVLPDVAAVLDIFFEIRIAQPAVSEDDRLVEVDAELLADLGVDGCRAVVKGLDGSRCGYLDRSM